MYRFEGSEHDVDAAVEISREQILPLEQRMDGFQGLIVLADREAKTLVSITLWETEEHLEASDESAKTITRFTAQTAHGKRQLTERFQVTLLELGP
jgi:heme-degrading monooxygenase HmoA